MFFSLRGISSFLSLLSSLEQREKTGKTQTMWSVTLVWDGMGFLADEFYFRTIWKHKAMNHWHWWVFSLFAPCHSCCPLMLRWGIWARVCWHGEVFLASDLESALSQFGAESTSVLWLLSNLSLSRLPRNPSIQLTPECTLSNELPLP